MIFINFSLKGLKAKITFVIVPVMAVKFVQKTLKYDNAADVFYEGTAISPVAALMMEKQVREVKKKLDKESETRGARDLKK